VIEILGKGGERDPERSRSRRAATAVTSARMGEGATTAVDVIASSSPWAPAIVSRSISVQEAIASVRFVSRSRAVWDPKRSGANHANAPHPAMARGHRVSSPPAAAASTAASARPRASVGRASTRARGPPKPVTPVTTR